MYIPNEIDKERLGMTDWMELSAPEKFLILKRRGEIMTGQKMFTVGSLRDSSETRYLFWKAGRGFDAPDHIIGDSIGEAVHLYLKHYEYADPADRNSLFAVPKPREP